MRSVVKTIIRIILIVLFLQILFELFQHGASLWSLAQNSTSDIYLRFLYNVLPPPIIASLILGILWWKTDWLVRTLTGDAPDDSLVITTSNLDFFIVAVRILGIFLIVSAVADLVGHITYRITFINHYPEEIAQQLDINWIRELATGITTLIIGLFLIFWRIKYFNPLRNLWNTASFSGTKPDSKEE